MINGRDLVNLIYFESCPEDASHKSHTLNKNKKTQLVFEKCSIISIL